MTTLDRRTMLAAAIFAATHPSRVSAALPTSDPVGPAPAWLAFAAQAAAFPARAARRGLTADFIPGHPVDLTVAPPATEAEVAAVEGELGRALPSSLRSFFRAFSSHFAVSWVMPGPDWMDQRGQVHAGVPLSPPPILLPSGEPGPPIGGGQLEIALGAVVPRWRSLQATLRDFEGKARSEGEEHRRRFHALRREFWGRAFPFAGGEEGDLVGIDVTDARQRLLLLSGEAADEPGFFLGQDLAEHLDQQARLGFIGLDLSSLLLFRDEAAGAAAVASGLSPIEDAARRDGMLPPAGVVVDADGANGRRWRAWLDA